MGDRVNFCIPGSSVGMGRGLLEDVFHSGSLMQSVRELHGPKRKKGPLDRECECKFGGTFLGMTLILQGQTTNLAELKSSNSKG